MLTWVSRVQNTEAIKYPPQKKGKTPVQLSYKQVCGELTFVGGC